jgi:pimeloyl-ACP methyl ester carboxylesterase
MWQNLMEAFKDKYRILAYDILGKNDCYDNHRDFSVEHFINDLLKLMYTLKISKAILCGFSLGGFIALKAFENYPDRFETLLINDHNSEDERMVTNETVIQAIENIRISGVKMYEDQNLKLIFSPESMTNNSKEIVNAWGMILKSVAQVNFKTVKVKTNPLRKFMRQYPAFIETNYNY